MNRNPFSLYDFMGYLFPGCLAIIIISYCYILDFNIYKIADINNINELLNLCNNIEWESSLIIIIVGYTLGHILSYLSSLILEVWFTIRAFGYPYDYLLNEKTYNFKQVLKNIFLDNHIKLNRDSKRLKLLRVIIGVLMFIIIFPIGVMVLVFAFFDLLQKIAKPIDSYLQTTLKQKQYRLAERLKINHPDVNEHCDYHRIIMHYVYLNVPDSQRKINNYLALYGFLRSLSFLLCLTFVGVTVMALKTIDFSAAFNYDIFFLLVFIFALAVVLYFAFIKFYRRFTLENLMSLLVGMPEDLNNSSTSTNDSNHNCIKSY